MASPDRPESADVISKIEAVFENIADSLLNEENPCVPAHDIFIQLRHKNYTTPPSDTPTLFDAEPEDKLTNVCFPARGRPREAWRFTVLIRILDLIHEALCDNVIVSKRCGSDSLGAPIWSKYGSAMTTFHGRNIYYKDPALFRTQSTVDIYVDKLAYTFGVSRLALNVTAAAKGLVTGHFILTRTDGTQASRKPDVPHLIEDPHDIQTIDTSDVAWVLVVEKESTFRTLASSNIHRNSIAGHGMIVTAKGYPDVSTRSFLHRLSVSDDPDCLPLPIYALCDFDPDGLAIMSTYKHGSFKLSHENAGLNTPSIQWLGIRAESVLAGNGQDDYHGLLTLSARDRKKAVDMLERMEPLQESGTEEEWRRELQVMLLLNVKAEMEILAEREGDVRRWVDEKLLKNLANLHTDENSLMTKRLGDMTLGLDGSYRLQANEESLLDTHETPETLAVGEDPLCQQADEDLLDTHEMAAMSCSEEDSRSLQLDDRCLDTHQPEDISPGETGFPRPEWDEEL